MASSQSVSSSSSTLYLEQYLDSLDSLPGELRRNFTLMYDLDQKNKKILQDVDAASDEYLRKVDVNLKQNLVRVAPDCNRSYCEDSFS